jgi:hypothetical protein
MGGCYYPGVALDPSHVTKIDKAWLEGPKGSHIFLKPLAMSLLRLEFLLRPSWVCVISLVPVHCDLVYPSCCWYTEWERNDHDSNSCKFWKLARSIGTPPTYPAHTCLQTQHIHLYLMPQLGAKFWFVSLHCTTMHTDFNQIYKARASLGKSLWQNQCKLVIPNEKLEVISLREMTPFHINSKLLLLITS